MQYIITNNTLTAEVDGEVFTATPNHPNWDRIVAAVHGRTDEKVADLIDVTREANAKAIDAGVDVRVIDNTVYVNGKPAQTALAQQIRDFAYEGHDFTPLANFYSKIEDNPSAQSRDNLHEWLATHDFTITRDGDIVGYKSVSVDRDDDGNEVFGSIHRGYGIVNGVEVEHGSLPQVPGTTVEMPRDMVDPDPERTCSTGLHVATKDYADGFGGGGTVTVLVKVNPADVVAVPGDYQRQKMRVAKYEVIGKSIDQPMGRLFAEDFGVAMVTDNEFVAENEQAAILA